MGGCFTANIIHTPGHFRSFSYRHRVRVMPCYISTQRDPIFNVHKQHIRMLVYITNNIETI